MRSSSTAVQHVPVAPASEPKVRQRPKRLPRVAAPALPSPDSPNAKALISALFPRVLHPVTLACTDPAVADAAREQLALAEEIKQLELEREVCSNVLRLAVRGSEGIQAGEFTVTWSEARGDTDYRAIFAHIMATHPETVGTIQAALSEVETHAGVDRSRFRKQGSRRLSVKRGE